MYTTNLITPETINIELILFCFKKNVLSEKDIPFN